jgi:hypothetical protein
LAAEANMNKSDLTMPPEEFWNVFDFARRYRLGKKEENRLLMLFGPLAPRDALLANARRHALIA